MTKIAFSILATVTALLVGQANAQSINDRVKRLEDRVSAVATLQEFTGNRQRNAYARVDCTSRRFGSVQTDDDMHLVILVSCETLDPYLEGYRVTLQIGNPYYMRLASVKGSLYYGEQVLPANKIEIPLAGGLRPGTWTRTTVNITPATAAQMRNLRAEFFVEEISLSP
ncbi:MAG: hypothetical protein ACM3SS_19665 [Rhodospirillaceae bacterium]